MFEDFDVIDFRIMSSKDKSSKRWNNWSRAYEYEFVLGLIDKEKPKTIHNTASGGQMKCHQDFVKSLEERCEFVHNSDMFVESNKFSNYFQYDIRTVPDKKMKYDIVICISTLEHIDGDKKQVLLNLSRQLGDEGMLIITFDIPNQNSDEIAEGFGDDYKCPNKI